MPVGGISLALIAVFLRAQYSGLNSPENFKESQLRRWLRLDWVGTVVCLGVVTCLTLPLQWGGNTKRWTDSSVVALFCVHGVVLIIFLVWELYLGGRALLPLHLLKNRTQLGCCLLSFWIMLMFLSGIYYLPLFYQAKVRIPLHRLLGLSLCKYRYNCFRAIRRQNQALISYPSCSQPFPVP